MSTMGGTTIGNVWVGASIPVAWAGLHGPRERNCRRKLGFPVASLIPFFSAMLRMRNDAQSLGVLSTSAPGRTAVLVPRSLDSPPLGEMNGRLFNFRKVVYNGNAR
ncbi:hypothetical protein LY76DRAFT_52964 [Colletotrichum caudatum]|nr:hypothetical protein LY76DRAFT_52964 [Colletotrichum caudatum]